MEGGSRGGGRRTRPFEAALLPRHRRRPGRHRARRAPEAARRADHHRREERASGRQLAQALQVALPARPGLVRPYALSAVPCELAGILAQGQDRRLAGNVRQGDGAQRLGFDRSEKRDLRRTERRMDSRPRPVRREDHAAAQTTGLRNRHGQQADRSRPPRPRRLQGRPASFLAAPWTGRLCRETGSRDRLEHLGP